MNYILEGLDCAHCAAKIERELNKIEGLEPVSVNFAAKSLHLDPAFAPAAQKVIDRIEPGVKLIPQSQGEGEPGGDGRKGWQEYLSSFRILAAGVLFLIGLIFQKPSPPPPTGWGVRSLPGRLYTGRGTGAGSGLPKYWPGTDFR